MVCTRGCRSGLDQLERSGLCRTRQCHSGDPRCRHSQRYPGGQTASGRSNCGRCRSEPGSPTGCMECRRAALDAVAAVTAAAGRHRGLWLQPRNPSQPASGTHGTGRFHVHSRRRHGTDRALRRQHEYGAGRHAHAAAGSHRFRQLPPVQLLATTGAQGTG
jgi:hypothetical protein